MFRRHPFREIRGKDDLRDVTSLRGVVGVGVERLFEGGWLKPLKIALPREPLNEARGSIL